MTSLVLISVAFLGLWLLGHVGVGASEKQKIGLSISRLFAEVSG